MGIVKKIFEVFSVTTLSRVFGVIRDVVMFRVFGAGSITSAFVFGFTVPNLFRRLLGEGALNSALIPIFSQTLLKEDEQAAFCLLNRVLSRLGLILLSITTIGIVFLLGLDSFFDPEGRYHLCCKFCMILLPYVFFVCISAVLSAILNVFNRFVLATGNPILLSVSMIGSMLLVQSEPDEMLRIYVLCGGVLFGGMLQVLFLCPSLMRLGWRFRLDFSMDESVAQFQKLFLPGVLGASVVQINIAVSRGLAYLVSAYAVSRLYLSSRFTELPLGLFAIAITTVIFPTLSNAEVKGDKQKVAKMFTKGIQLVLMIIIPSVVGIIWLSDSMLVAIFLGGNFSMDDVVHTVPTLIIYTLGLPFYSLSTLLVKGFHVKKNTTVPMRISIVNCMVNIFLTVIWMYPFQEKGIAAANIVAATVQVMILYRQLKRRYEEYTLHWRELGIVSMIISALIMLFVLYRVDGMVWHGAGDRLEHIVRLLIEVPIGVIVYFGTYGTFCLLKHKKVEQIES